MFIFEISIGSSTTTITLNNEGHLHIANFIIERLFTERSDLHTKHIIDSLDIQFRGVHGRDRHEQ
jgi:hypothetical protein